MRMRVLRNEPIWQDLQSSRPEETHYVGRALEHIKTALQSGNEAVMANSNDGMWMLQTGQVNLLMGNLATVRQLTYPMLQELYHLGDLDLNSPVKTYGKDSPIEECKKLER